MEANGAKVSTQQQRLLSMMDFTVIKINGHDLRNSSQMEAVKAFELADEPIVVEVVRNANNRKMTVSDQDRPGSSKQSSPVPPSHADKCVQTDWTCQFLDTLLSLASANLLSGATGFPVTASTMTTPPSPSSGLASPASLSHHRLSSVSTASRSSSSSIATQWLFREPKQPPQRNHESIEGDDNGSFKGVKMVKNGPLSGSAKKISQPPPFQWPPLPIRGSLACNGSLKMKDGDAAFDCDEGENGVGGQRMLVVSPNRSRGKTNSRETAVESPKDSGVDNKTDESNSNDGSLRATTTAVGTSCDNGTEKRYLRVEPDFLANNLDAEFKALNEEMRRLQIECEKLEANHGYREGKISPRHQNSPVVNRSEPMINLLSIAPMSTPSALKTESLSSLKPIASFKSLSPKHPPSKLKSMSFNAGHRDSPLLKPKSPSQSLSHSSSTGSSSKRKAKIRRRLKSPDCVQCQRSIGDSDDECHVKPVASSVLSLAQHQPSPICFTKSQPNIATVTPLRLHSFKEPISMVQSSCHNHEMFRQPHRNCFFCDSTPSKLDGSNHNPVIRGRHNYAKIRPRNLLIAAEPIDESEHLYCEIGCSHETSPKSPPPLPAANGLLKKLSLPSPYAIESLDQFPSAPSDGKSPVPGEWKVKVRPDGTRYITSARGSSAKATIRHRRKAQLLADHMNAAAFDVTTDDDQQSELKVGKFWSKSERKRHLEKAKERRRRKWEQKLSAAGSSIV